MISSLSSRAHTIDSYVSHAAMPTDEGGPNGPRLTSLFVGGFAAVRG